MKSSRLQSTLNDKQKAYVRMGLDDPRNGEYMLAVFRLIPSARLNILQAAAEIAA